MKLKLNTANIFLVLYFLMISPLVISQGPNSDDALTRKEKIARLKIAFITKELDLSLDQSEKFWPVYNELTKKIDDEKKARKKTAKNLKENLETLSEADIKKKTNSVLDSDIKTAKLKKEYNEKIAAIIGYKKATKLLSLDAKFKRELLKKLNNSGTRPAQRPNARQGGRQGGQQGGRRRVNR